MFTNLFRKNNKKQVMPSPPQNIYWEIGMDLNYDDYKDINGFVPFASELEGYNVPDLGFLPRKGDFINIAYGDHTILVEVMSVIVHAPHTALYKYFAITTKTIEIYETETAESLYTIR